MRKNTEVDYKNAIIAKYEKEKLGDFHSFLSNPSPAQLRELCLLKYDNGLNKSDEMIFRLYFKIGEIEDLRNSIYNYHIPKFKSIGIFLTKNYTHRTTNILNLNLLAVLVDFNPRPYNKFNKSEINSVEEVVGELTVEEEETGMFFLNAILKVQESPNTNSEKKNFRKKNSVLILVLVCIFLVGYTSKTMFFSDDCMQWNGDHYEKVNCNSEKKGIGSFAEITRYDSELFELKKIAVCDTTTFFNRDKALVWYCKVNGDREYFTSHGFHPVTGKSLKPITKYIINKYVKPCK